MFHASFQSIRPCLTPFLCSMLTHPDGRPSKPLTQMEMDIFRPKSSGGSTPLHYIFFCGRMMINGKI